MRNINLMPKIPRIQALFVPLLITISIVMIAPALGLIINGINSKLDSSADNKKITSLQMRITQLQKERVVQPEMQDYTVLSAELNKLIDGRRFWLSTIEAISSNLPNKARILTMSTSNPDKVMVTLQIADLQSIAQYMVLLQKAGLFNEVIMKSIELKQLKIPPKTIVSQTTNSLGVSDTPSISLPEGQQPGISMKDYLKSLDNTNVPVEDRGDQLLNELNWYVTQQVSQQELGIPVPDKSFDLPSTASTEKTGATGAFTEKEIADAQKKLTDFKSTKISKDTVIEQKPENNTLPVAKIPNIYEIHLELILKPLSVAK